MEDSAVSRFVLEVDHISFMGSNNASSIPNTLDSPSPAKGKGFFSYGKRSAAPATPSPLAAYPSSSSTPVAGPSTPTPPSRTTPSSSLLSAPPPVAGPSGTHFTATASKRSLEDTDHGTRTLRQRTGN
ncbi:hypothetical protein NLJ89_g12375 [Agrocybe chaxingu]|uniref:Uncharacterized protein n=1 Tax=Agrocybe chaxingu TaxID=84603 RepID=A0A9W8JN86_9AGAR|nr:hypothetical protein NLJ89_g12375 [Agrocybe chaxingu]